MIEAFAFICFVASWSPVAPWSSPDNWIAKAEAAQLRGTVQRSNVTKGLKGAL